MTTLSLCSLCCNELNNKIICSNCSRNKDDPKYICHNCIIKLDIYRIYLENDNNLIEDEDVKKEKKYDNILIQYTCPYCNELSEYRLNDLDDKDNIKFLTIILTKFLIILLYNNHIFVNKLIQDNINLKKKVKLLECNFPITILIHNKYILICFVIIINSLIYLFIIIFNQLIQ